MNRSILPIIVLIFSFSISPSNARAELFSDQDVTSQGAKLLAGLALLDNFTGVELSEDLLEKYNLFAAALSKSGTFEPGTPEAKTALDAAERAYNVFLTEYGQQLKRLESISDGTVDEIFEAVNWSSDAFEACVSYREELLGYLKADINAPLNDKSINDELAECEIRLNKASIKLDELVNGWKAEIVEKEKRVAFLKDEHAKAVSAGDKDRADEIQNEIDQIEDEEIPEIEQKIEKSKKVKGSFSLEKLLQGLGKMVLGVISILFSGECGEDAAGACENIGIGLIESGADDVGEAFDPPDETEYYTETEKADAVRENKVIEKENAITTAVVSDPVPLCCPPKEIKEDLVIVPTKEDGPLSFGYEQDGGLVAKVYLINNADGAVLAEIDDAQLFFKTGGDLPDVSTKVFSSLDSAKTQKTKGGTHLIKFVGTLAKGGTASLGVAISPLTFSGKYKVTYRPSK